LTDEAGSDDVPAMVRLRFRQPLGLVLLLAACAPPPEPRTPPPVTPSPVDAAAAGAGGLGGAPPAAPDPTPVDAAPVIATPADAGAASDGTAAPPAEGSASAACAGGATMPAPDGYQTLMSGGRLRKYLVRAPRVYDGKKPLALFFALHGGGADGMSFETRIASIRAAIGDRAIYVYPDGLADKGGTVTWARDFKDDLAFVDAIFAAIGPTICYDTSRVVAFGQSSGAYFANTLGCNRAGVFRAIASNGGGVRKEEFAACNGKPVAAWISNGTMDPSHLPDAKAARDYWLKSLGCSADNPLKVSPDPCVSYAGCAPGFPLHYCQNPGGHDIPAYAPMGVAEFFLGNFDR
jgi:polyhydroxybutyrate depolymerase